MARSLPGSAELPRAARSALRRHRSRAGALPGGHFDHAGVRVVDVLEAPLPQERLGVGGPGWPKAAESAAWHQGAAAASLRDPSGEGCPVLLGPMGSPEQVGGPLERQVGPPELLCVRAAPGVPGEPGANQGSHRGAPGEPGASQGSQGSQGRARALLSMPTHRNSFFLGGSSDPARPRCFFLFL